MFDALGEVLTQKEIKLTCKAIKEVMNHAAD